MIIVLNKIRTMDHGLCVGLILFFVCVAGINADNYECKGFLDIGCDTNSTSMLMIDKEAQSQRCPTEKVEDINFIVENSDGPNWTGKVGVNFTFPNVKCKYKVALLVNTSITRREDCNDEIFHKTNSVEAELHTDDQIICVSGSSNQSSPPYCQKKKFSIDYTHVFTGCYALRFVLNNGLKYYVRGSTFLTTNFSRTDVVRPRLECQYSENELTNGISEADVKFTVQIAAHASIPHLNLTYAPVQNFNGTDQNACGSKNKLHAWTISTNRNHSQLIQNCTKYGDNKNESKIDCKLTVKLPQNVGYCLRVEVLDKRCHKRSLWKPRQDEEDVCQSTIRCEKDKFTSDSMIHSDLINLDYVFFLPIAIAVMLIILIVTCTILFVYRSHSRYDEQRVWANTKLRALKIATEIDSVETTDDEATKGSNNSDEGDAIILLYARGSPVFMSLMSDFREILKNYCSCHVYDWYAASEWDTVARLGPSAWVADLLKQNNRAIWIDSPRVRSLIAVQWKNNHMSELKRTYQRCLDEDTISDFRDIALPSVLDLAKKNITPQPTLQYSKHFVVRLEGFEAAANRNEDPFEDLSPHTRYLIPHHLSELCSHISSWRTNVNTERLKSEGAQFRERLIRMKNSNS